MIKLNTASAICTTVFIVRGDVVYVRDNHCRVCRVHLMNEDDLGVKIMQTWITIKTNNAAHPVGPLPPTHPYPQPLPLAVLWGFLMDIGEGKGRRIEGRKN